MTSSGLLIDQGQLKAIETIYNGYRFRSRLEARWAVFFDEMKMPYLYEPEGFDLGNGIWYLPDFWLPAIETWIEIKPTKPDDSERRKAYLLSAKAKQVVAILFGYPNAQFEEIHDGYGLYMSQGCKMEIFIGEWWDEFGLHLDWRDYFFGEDGLPKFLKDKFPDLPIPDVGNDEASIKRLIELDEKYYREKYSKEHPTYRFGRSIDDAFWQEKKDGRVIPSFMAFNVSNRMANALIAARQARFEFGENGR